MAKLDSGDCIAMLNWWPPSCPHPFACAALHKARSEDMPKLFGALKKRVLQRHQIPQSHQGESNLEDVRLQGKSRVTSLKPQVTSNKLFYEDLGHKDRGLTCVIPLDGEVIQTNMDVVVSMHGKQHLYVGFSWLLSSGHAFLNWNARACRGFMATFRTCFLALEC